VRSRNMASNSALATVGLLIARRRGRLVTGGTVVVLMWWRVLCSTSRWIPVGRVSAGNLLRRSINGALLPIVFTLGMDVGAAWSGADRDVVRRGGGYCDSRLGGQKVKEVRTDDVYQDVGHHEAPGGLGVTAN
jgi:hypothetical protein